jgi:hypothetical protein
MVMVHGPSCPNNQHYVACGEQVVTSSMSDGQRKDYLQIQQQQQQACLKPVSKKQVEAMDAYVVKKLAATTNYSTPTFALDTCSAKNLDLKTRFRSSRNVAHSCSNTRL